MKPIQPKLALKLINFYPPFLGAGIRVKFSAPDLSRITVQLRQTLLNRNVVGTHFGGSLYAMCDPFYMFMMMQALGRDYIVWDKAASIEFIKPGRGTVSATFELPAQEAERVRELAETEAKVEPVYETFVLSSDGERIAHVKKKLYVRKKPRHRRQPAA